MLNMHEVSGISEIPEYERLFDGSVFEKVKLIIEVIRRQNS